MKGKKLLILVFLIAAALLTMKMIPSSIDAATTYAIPGQIEAEEYSAMSGIGLETCSEGGQNVGWIDTGDWMDYSINVNATGSYKVEYRVSSPYATGRVDLRSGAVNLATSSIPETGGWQTWTTVSATVTLNAGIQTIRIYANAGGWNLNWVKITALGTVTPTPTPTPTPLPPTGNRIPGKIESENYSAMSGVETEACSEGTLNVGWIDTGDWMDYAVNVQNTGSYKVEYRVSSPNTTGRIDFRLGTTTLASTPVTGTGGWQTWTTVSATVNLNSGNQTIRIYAGSGGWNINWINFTTSGTSTATPTPTQAITPTPTSTASNLALGRPVIASSIQSSDMPAANAVDGNTGTRWSSAFSDPQWIYVDLGSICTISQVKLNWEAAYARSYSIQISNDATSWTSLWSTTSGAGGTVTINVSGSGRYVRMYGTTRSTQYGYSLWEFEVYGAGGPTPTPGPTPTSTPTPPPGGTTAQIIQTSQAGDRLTTKPSLTFSDDDGSNLPLITIYPAQTYQTIIGFGGALTESSAYVLDRAGAAKRSQILNEYFSASGSNYTMARVHINSCDFSLGNWNYDNVAGDTNLTNFSIAHDRELIIPLIKDAKAISPNLKVFASPWSPPGWMKQNGQMNGGSPLRTEYYGTWALYFSKYIKAYAAEGVGIWGVTIQNEPMHWPTWEGCQYSITQMRDFLKNHLGPQLKNDPATSAVNIMIFDHNKGEIVQWADGILGDATAASYAWGTAFHWYGEDNFGNLTTVHNKYPSKHLIHTEGCQEGGPHLNEWAPAERYGHKMMGDLNNWTEAWVDWNIVLDQQGGPNHVNNFCSAPIHVDLTNGNIIHNPSYYYITQISRYVKPGAVRIGWSSNVPGTEMTAFKNPDGKIAVIVMNNSANNVSFKLKNGTRIIKPSLPAHSIATYIF